MPVAAFLSTPNARRVSVGLSFLLVLCAGAALRLVQLENRPMHADEAVHAVKFGDLLERGRYIYDPHEYHGPALNYLTLPLAWVAGGDRLAEVSEAHLRRLPATFGILLIGLVWLLRKQLGTAAALTAAALTAVSPALVFYSRYYIQEMLLAASTFGAIVVLWRIAAPPGEPWNEDTTTEKSVRSECAVAGEPSEDGSSSSRIGVLLPLVLGFCLGMMHASKETCAIAYVAMAVAACVSLGGWIRQVPRLLLLRASLLMLATALLVSAAFHSSFLQNPRGIADSVATYFHYVHRAAGQGSAGPQVQPWYQYLRWLFWPAGGNGLWSEAAIAVLALPGLIAAVAGRGMLRRRVPFARFVAAYALVMLLVYSAMPYKTPWCVVGALHGLILLAGIGAAVLLKLLPGRAARLTLSVLIVAAVAQLGWQAYAASFIDFDAPHNPYVYAHARRDVVALTEQIEQIAACHPDGQDMHIQVVCVEGDYWPLPWYLRRLGRVGWFDVQPPGPPAPLIVTWPQWEPQIIEYLYLRQPPGQRPLYISLTEQEQQPGYQLRPGVPLRIYVQRDLWLTYLDSAALGADL